MKPTLFESPVLEDHALLDSGEGEKLERFGPVTLRRPDPQALWFEPLHSEEMVLVVSSSHPYARRRRVGMVELHKQPLVLLSSQFTTRRLLDECFASCGAQPLVVVEMNAVMPMIGLVAKTQLGTIISEHAVPERSDICVLPLENPNPLRTPGLLWKRGAPQSPAAKALATEIRRTALKRSLRKFTAAPPDKA